MQTHVTKWGNSLGIRIPSALAKEFGLAEGVAVEFQVDGDAIVIRRKRLSLELLLAEVTPQNMHTEITTGPALGREAW